MTAETFLALRDQREQIRLLRSSLDELVTETRALYAAGRIPTLTWIKAHAAIINTREAGMGGVKITHEIIGWHTENPARGVTVMPGQYDIIDDLGDTLILDWNGEDVTVSKIEAMDGEIGTYGDELNAEIRGEL